MFTWFLCAVPAPSDKRGHCLCSKMMLNPRCDLKLSTCNSDVLDLVDLILAGTPGSIDLHHITFFPADQAAGDG